ncbi:MAG: hypothetical protein SAL07_18710 [Oscillatoria sp. PMC 1051.18]|nr:hypothetical protein [Oscillatoria sp. PMC 1050.18]MEC5031935.1 hypothetical protein [Oscillatoria sp. PMC 1051.18]
MKIVEQTSTHLILKNSGIATWITRLACLPFLILGSGGLFLIISEIINEKTFPPLMGILFTLFCTYIGILGVFWSDTRSFVFDKTKKQLNFTIKKLLKHTNRKYSFDEVAVQVKRTSRRTSRISAESNSLVPMRNSKEPVFVVVLQIASNSQEIYLSGNYTLGINRNFNRNEAVEFAKIVRDFMNTPL